MKRRQIFRTAGKAGCFLMLALTLGATEMKAAGIKILRAGTGGDEGAVPEIYAFGGRGLPVRLDYTAAAGTRIAWTSELFLASSSMAAPLERSSPLIQVVEAEAGHELWLPEVHLPEVKQRTEMWLKILGRAEGSESGCTNIRIHVYPLDTARPLKELVSGGIRLAVFGKSEAIRSFLRANQIAFEELGADIPSQIDPRLFLIGDIEKSRLDDWMKHFPKGAGIRLVAFTRDPWGVPGAYMQVQPGATICKVTVAILDGLVSNPRSQATFVELLSKTL